MSSDDPQRGLLTITNMVQLIAGIVFISLGIVVFLKQFPDNNILIGKRKALFAFILMAYGLLKFYRFYRLYRTQKH